MKMIQNNKSVMKLTAGLGILLLAITCLITSGYAKTSPSSNKFALIIGNGAYKSGPLKNPTHDAILLGETLKNLGFELIGGKPQLNLTRESLANIILDFGDKLRATKGVGVFYFAGHGVQLKGKNYLIPVDAKMEREEQVGIYAVPVENVLEQMESADNKLNLMILDACRNNPFKSSTRSLTRGVKISSAPSGTLILYATRPGRVSLDGDQDNSPFTEALTSNMKKPGLKIEDVMRATIKEVEKKTFLRQTPWQEGFVREEFYFVQPDVSNGKCPSGTRMQNGQCVINRVVCPAGTQEQNGQCIAQVNCPPGMKFVTGKGCAPVLVAQLGPDRSTGVSKNLLLNQPIGPAKPSFVSQIPWWSYGALLVGVTAHSLNATMSSATMINSSFGVALFGYAVTGLGVGYGAYKYATWEPSPTR